jgi:hypothetical protein
MTNRIIYQAAVWIFLGTMLIVWFGCGGSDDSGVDKPTAAEDSSTDDTSVDNPPTVADVPTDNINVDTPPTVVVDAPTDNVSVDTPPMVEDAPADDVIVEVVVGSLQGQVSWIEGVQIHIRVLQNGAAIAATEANPDGSYQIDDIKPETYTVQIAAQDYKDVEQIVQVRAGEVSVLANVVLEALEPPPTHIRGLVLDEQTNTPLNGIRIQLIDEAGSVREALTKQTGGFEFENVPADQGFTLIVDTEKYEKQEITIDPISEGEVGKLEVELAPINIDALPIGDGLQVGVAAPAFNLPDQDGKRQTLADYSGQKVLLSFDRGRW